MLRGGEKEGTSRPTAPDPVVRMGEGVERVVCLLKGIAEGTYKTKHAEAAKLYYTTMYPHTQTLTQTCTGLYGGRQASSLRDIARTKRNQRLLSPRLRKLGRGGDPGAELGDQGWSDAQ